MSASNHPEYTQESKRCEGTLAYVEKSLEAAANKKEKVDSDTDRLKKHFNSDNSQDYIDLAVNTILQDDLQLKIRNLIAARSKPYFARVDFTEDGKDKKEKLYIGKMNLSRDDNLEIIILDWRAPVANLYYESRIGSAEYACPEGIIKGNVSLKRQFSIDKGILKDIVDVDVTTTDELLQTCLGANADNRLKDIVSTIQAEQNAIIRADMWTPLIVQGAAGSGKTTIALHRIAYLIYTYEKSFKPENFMIIAPNRLFLNYISEVLPELGVERVKQTTFEEFAMELVGKKLKIKDPYDKLITFVEKNDAHEHRDYNNLLKKASELKVSMLFRDMLDIFIEEIENKYIPKESFRVGQITLFKYEEISKLFLEEYKRLPIAQRLNEIKKHMVTRLRNRKEAIVSKLHDECDRRIMMLKESMPDCKERQEKIIRAIDRKNDTITNLEKYSKKAINDYIKKIAKVSPLEYYTEFLEKSLINVISKYPQLSKEFIEFVKETSLSIIKSGYYELEDLAPIIYLKYQIYGMDEKLPVKHIVIDEAQDFSVFQLYVMSKIVKDSSFTILGDLCQGINAYRGIKDWEDVGKYVFHERKNQYLTLEQSYRTTVEIMNAAKSVIRKIKDEKLIEAKPVIRHGEEVRFFKSESVNNSAQEIASDIKSCLNEGFKSIAVICKTISECKKLNALLKKTGIDIALITGKEDEYKSGIVLVPSYLAKGLEFDVVIIADAGKTKYSEDTLDAKLLYVAMTRPLHKLHIYYVGEISTLLQSRDGSQLSLT